MILKVQDLVKKYGDFTALDKISLSIPKGSIYGFLGPNGAGKTTTIRSIMGIIEPNDGKIEIFGESFKAIGSEQKKSIGYVSQEQFFYEWMTCRQLGEFVSGFYPTWDNSVYHDFLERFELPKGRKVSKLSVGMKLKLALSLALSHNPRILILDEPTSGLDPLSRREFLEIIQRHAKEHDLTTFFSSHIIEEVERIADTIGIINKGKVLYEGPIEKLHDDHRVILCDVEKYTRKYQEKVDAFILEGLCTKLYDNSFEDIVEVYLTSKDWTLLTGLKNALKKPELEDIFIALTKTER